jgi:hypothetical protein
MSLQDTAVVAVQGHPIPRNNSWTCYLLQSVNPVRRMLAVTDTRHCTSVDVSRVSAFPRSSMQKHKNATYIGYTQLHVSARLSQHNRGIGAKATRTKLPWAVLATVSNFNSRMDALLVRATHCQELASTDATPNPCCCMYMSSQFESMWQQRKCDRLKLEAHGIRMRAHSIAQRTRLARLLIQNVAQFEGALLCVL